jgi:haloalkane dehalogenase
MKVLTRKLATLGIGIIPILLVTGFVLQFLVFPQLPLLTQGEYEVLFPFEGYYAQLDNATKVHYIDEGEGPILLLLHGNPNSAFLYREMITRLKSDYRVIAPDYPGFGQSRAPAGYGYTAQVQADTMVLFFDAMALDDVVIMVEDWAGPWQDRPDSSYLADSWVDPLGNG